MMVGGMWVIVDPTGTVGALGRWANQASLGTLAVAARGTPAAPGGRSASSLGRVFAAAIEAPWCYLEFGDVGWCREPSQLDPRLRAAGAEDRRARARRGGLSRRAPLRWRLHAAPSGAQAKALEHSAELLREAHSQRRDLPRAARERAGAQLDQRTGLAAAHSVREQRSDELSRSDRRAGRVPHERRHAGRGSAGLLLIAGGLLGMLLLLGFVALRLLDGGALQPAVPAAGARDGARAGVRRGRPGAVSPVGAAAARRGRLEAAVLVSARGGAGGARDPLAT